MSYGNLLKSDTSQRIIDFAEDPANPASLRHALLASSVALVEWNPIEPSKETTFCSCCSTLSSGTDREKSCTANSPPGPCTTAIPTEVSRRSRIFLRWPGESIQPL